MDGLSLIITLLSGGAGGVLGGKLAKSGPGKAALIIIGIIGGTGLAAVLQYIPGVNALFGDPAGGGLNLSGFIGGVLAGGIGGTVLSFILSKLMGGKG